MNNNSVTRSQIYSIRNKLKDFNSEFKELKEYLKENILIDKKTIEEEKFNLIKNSNENILEEIRERILPTINND